MNITYLHGFSIRLTFLDYFTLLLYYFLDGYLWEWVSPMQLYDIIRRQFQDPILIICFNFVIISSSHKLSATLLSSKKKIKNEQTKTKTYLATTSMCWLSRAPFPGLTLHPWFLNLCESSSSDVYSSFDKTDQIFKPYWFLGLNCTALKLSI